MVYTAQHVSSYIHIYEQETSASMCCVAQTEQEIRGLFDEFSYSFNTYSCLWNIYIYIYIYIFIIWQAKTKFTF